MFFGNRALTGTPNDHVKCLYQVSGNVHCQYIACFVCDEPETVGTGSYGVGYRAVSVSLHGHLGVLISIHYRKMLGKILLIGVSFWWIR